MPRESHRSGCCMSARGGSSHARMSTKSSSSRMVSISRKKPRYIEKIIGSGKRTYAFKFVEEMLDIVRVNGNPVIQGVEPQGELYLSMVARGAKSEPIARVWIEAPALQEWDELIMYAGQVMGLPWIKVTSWKKIDGKDVKCIRRFPQQPVGVCFARDSMSHLKVTQIEKGMRINGVDNLKPAIPDASGNIPVNVVHFYAPSWFNS
eukprot:UN04366